MPCLLKTPKKCPKNTSQAGRICLMVCRIVTSAPGSGSMTRKVALVFVKSSILIFPQALAAAKCLHQLPEEPLWLILLLLWALLIALQGTRRWTLSLPGQVGVAVLELRLRASRRRLHLTSQSTTSLRYVIVSGACAVSRVPPYCCGSRLCWRSRSGRLCRV